MYNNVEVNVKIQKNSYRDNHLRVIVNLSTMSL